jgi:hypothetical protein
MTAFVLALLTVAAPVPKVAPAPHEVKVGYRWFYGADVLAVHEVEGERVTFRCLSDPHRVWPASDGFEGWNVQSRARCLSEAAQYGRPLRE